MQCYRTLHQHVTMKIQNKSWAYRTYIWFSIQPTLMHQIDLKKTY